MFFAVFFVLACVLFCFLCVLWLSVCCGSLVWVGVVWLGS